MFPLNHHPPLPQSSHPPFTHSDLIATLTEIWQHDIPCTSADCVSTAPLPRACHNVYMCHKSLWLDCPHVGALSQTHYPMGTHCVQSCKGMTNVNHIFWYTTQFYWNKANLRDLIAATGLVISNWIQIVNFSALVTLKFDGSPWKTIGNLCYAPSSFVQNFVAIGEFKLELQSGNAQSGSNSTIFRAVRPWNLTDDLAKQ